VIPALVRPDETMACFGCGHRFAPDGVSAAEPTSFVCPYCPVITARDRTGRWYAQAASTATLSMMRIASGMSLELVAGPAPRQTVRAADVGTRAVVRWRERWRLGLAWAVLLFIPIFVFEDEIEFATEWSDVELFLYCLVVPALLAYPMLKAALARTALTLTNGRVELVRPRWPVPAIGRLRTLAATREAIGPVRAEDVRLWRDVVVRDGDPASVYEVTVRSTAGRTHRVFQTGELHQARFVFKVLVAHLAQWSEAAGAPAGTRA